MSDSENLMKDTLTRIDMMEDAADSLVAFAETFSGADVRQVDLLMPRVLGTIRSLQREIEQARVIFPAEPEGDDVIALEGIAEDINAAYTDAERIHPRPSEVLTAINAALHVTCREGLSRLKQDEAEGQS